MRISVILKGPLKQFKPLKPFERFKLLELFEPIG